MVCFAAFLEKQDAKSFAHLKNRLFSSEFIFYLLASIIFSCVIYLAYLSRIDFKKRAGDYIHVLLDTRDLWATPIPSLLRKDLWSADNLQEIFETSLFHLPYLLYFFTLLHVIFKWRRGTAKNQEALLAVTALMGICSYGLIIFRAGFDALFRVLPSFYVLAGYYHAAAWEWATRQIRGAADLADIVKKLLSFYKTVFLLMFPLFFLVDVTWNNGFYAGSIGAIRENKVHLKVDRADLYVPEYECQVVTEITRFIKKNTNEGDYIFALPFNPIWYFLTERKNPSYHEWILPGVLRKDEEQQKVVDELMARPPKYIIYGDIAIDGKEARRFSNYAKVIEAFIRANYDQKLKAGYFKVLGLK